MTDEPYRWLEAIANRREYIRDQLKGANPVFAISRPEGILLFGAGTGQSKVFEIYDRHALAALGHPVDIDKVRQAAIEAAHLEGFTRASEDVSLRRLINGTLGPLLKSAFEQIFAAPFLVELVLAELGRSQPEDVLVRLRYDGTPVFSSSGIVVAHTRAADEAAITERLAKELRPDMTAEQVVRLAVQASRETSTAKDPAAPQTAASDQETLMEAALLERTGEGRVRYRALASFSA